MTTLQKKSFKHTPVIAGVVLLHVGGLVAMNSGLLVRAYEAIVPVEMISEVVEPPQVQPSAPPPAPPPPKPSPATAPTPTPPQKSAPTPPPAPQPLAINDPTPAPNAPTGSTAPPAPLPLITAPVAASPAPAAPVSPSPPAPAKVVLPTSEADYLKNPPPPYPPVSKRLAEQGQVMMRVYVDENGIPLKAEIFKSSGYERLDAVAAATVMQWRYKPGTRGGVAEAMWARVPVDFKLN